jgi:hypothetical protein
MRTKLILILLVLSHSCFAQSAAPLPKDLEALQQQYQKALDAATQPITKRYLQELTVLQQKYTKAGDLNAALAVKEIVDGLTAQPSKEAVIGQVSIGPSKKELIATLSGSVWSGTWEYGDISLTFQGEDVIMDVGTKWERPGKVEVTAPRKLKLSIEANPQEKKPAIVHSLEISKNGMIMTGSRKVQVTKKP